MQHKRRVEFTTGRTFLFVRRYYKFSACVVDDQLVPQSPPEMCIELLCLHENLSKDPDAMCEDVN